MKNFLKSKVGFTLVELLVVVLILGIIIAIGIPAYRGVTKNAHIKVCNVNQAEIAKQAKEYCMDEEFNSDFNYKIVSDGEKGTIEANTMALSQDQIYLLTNDTHHGKPLCCPAGGTIIVTVIPHGSGIPKIEVVCDGGTDGDCHKAKK